VNGRAPFLLLAAAAFATVSGVVFVPAFAAGSWAPGPASSGGAALVGAPPAARESAPVTLPSATRPPAAPPAPADRPPQAQANPPVVPDTPATPTEEPPPAATATPAAEPEPTPLPPLAPADLATPPVVPREAQPSAVTHVAGVSAEPGNLAPDRKPAPLPARGPRVERREPAREPLARTPAPHPARPVPLPTRTPTPAPTPDPACPPGGPPPTAATDTHIDGDTAAVARPERADRCDARLSPASPVAAQPASVDLPATPAPGDPPGSAAHPVKDGNDR
jgi:hypothetical protein